MLGKILIDLRNTREEAISIAELKSNQDSNSAVPSTAREDTDYQFKSTSSLSSEKSLDQDDDDDKEPKYRLDPK